MKLFNKRVKPFKYSKTKRPWGWFDLYADNEKCTCKVLNIKYGECLSLQYHFKRDQFYEILDDDFIIEYSDKPVPKSIINEQDDDLRCTRLEAYLENHLVTAQALSGDRFGFKKFVVHRAHYLGDKQYGRILDIAFGENSESDVVRIRDKYDRTTESYIKGYTNIPADRNAFIRSVSGKRNK